MNRFCIGILCCALLGAGCASPPPFEPVARPELGDQTPAEIYEQVRATQPRTFKVLSSVVFEYRRRSLTALGVTEIDTESRAFTVVALTPAGMKLFELQGDESGTEAVFVEPELTRHGDPVDTIGEDIRTVYFDRLPPHPESGRIRGNTVVFEQETDAGRLEHVLGGDPPALLEKRLRDRRGVVWEATYHEYRERDGKLHPGGILLRHRRYGYRLILRLQEIVQPPAPAEPEDPATP